MVATTSLRCEAASDPFARVPAYRGRQTSTAGVAIRPFGTRTHFRAELPGGAIVVAPLTTESPSGSHNAGLAAVAGLAVLLAAPAPAHAQSSGDVPLIAEPATPMTSGRQTAAADTLNERVNAAHSASAAALEEEATQAAATDPALIQPASVDEPQPLGWRNLYLEVFINGETTGLIGNFKETPEGALAVAPDELTEVGVKPTPEATGPDGLVRLDRLDGVSYSIDESTQQIHLETTMEARAARRIDLASKGLSAEVDESAAAQANYGLVLNYSLYADSNNLTKREKDIGLLSGVSGSFDARVATPFGTLDQGLLSGYTNGDLQGVTRLNTTWSYVDEKRMLTYRAGDLVSGGLAWTRPVYLGGIQLQRNFSIRPDLVTLPMPSFRGTAAVPSTIEVYNQNVQTYSGDVGTGPFELDNIPVYAGNGQTRVVLRDAQGRETEASLPFYVSSKMLARGLYDFSADIGFARRGFGVDSFDYDKRPYGIGTVRYGATNWLTLEGHAEVGADLINGGIGATFPLISYGAMSIAGAGSHSDGATGGLVNVSVELGFGEWSVYARTQRTFGDYKDVASVTAFAEDAVPSGVFLFSADVPKAMDQVAVGVPSPFEGSSLNFSYTHFEAKDGRENHVAGVSYSQQLFSGRANAYVSAFKDLSQKDSFGVFAGLSFPLGETLSASTTVDSGPDGVRASAEISKPEGMEDGSYGWRVRSSQDKSNVSAAEGSYRSSVGRVWGRVQRDSSSVRASASVDGAIALAGGDIFATNRIDDSFAVVDVGAPDVEVLYENRPVGKSNRRGKKLVTGLSSFEPRTIAIDPKDLPVDANIAATKTIVRPGNRSAVNVNFGVSEDARAAIVTLLDANGAPLQAGLTGKLEGGGDFAVGYDGQAYIEGLSSQNTVTVTTDFQQTCTATFGYKPAKGEQVTIVGVKCQ